jgi:hypothetical protein
MPLFTTWYALIPGIILCLRGPGGHKALCPPSGELTLYESQAICQYLAELLGGPMAGAHQHVRPVLDRQL